MEGQADINRDVRQDRGHPAASSQGSCSRREGQSLTLVAVKTMMCWTSRQVRHGRTCSISAIIPAARGAAADVPVWPSVHPVPFCKSQSVVTFGDRGERPPVGPRFAVLVCPGWEPGSPRSACNNGQQKPWGHRAVLAAPEGHREESTAPQTMPIVPEVGVLGLPAAARS